MSDPFSQFDADPTTNSDPAGLPGFSLNAGVLGAYAAPEGGGPVIDSIEQRANESSGTASLGHSFDPRGPATDNDSIGAELPAQQMSNFSNDTSQLSGNLQSGVENLSGLSAFVPASVPTATGFPTAEPDNTPAPNPPSYSPPAASDYVPPYMPAAPDPGSYPTAGPAPVPNYSTAGMPDPAQAAYASGGSAVPSALAGVPPASGDYTTPYIPTAAGGAGGPLDSTAALGAAPGAAPGTPGQTSPGVPGQPGPPPSAPPGYLSASVPNADASLASAVSAAASGAGPHAALVAATVQLLTGTPAPGNPNVPGTVIVGGSSSVGAKGAPASIMAFGSVGGQAPQFTNNDQAGWFMDAVSSWQAANPPMPAQPQATQAPGTGDATGSPAPPPDAGSPDAGPAPDLIPGGGGGATPGGNFDVASPSYTGVPPGIDASTAGGTNQTVGGAVMGAIDQTMGQWGDQGQQSTIGQQMQGDDPVTSQAFQGELWTGMSGPDDSMWSSPLGGISDLGTAQAQGKDDNMWSSPLGGIGPDPNDTGQDNDPVTGKPNYDPSDIWSSPLGGISSVGTDWETGNQMPATSSWSNRMMTL